MGLTKCLIMNNFLFPTVLVLVLASPGSASQCRDDGSTPPDCQHWQDPEQPLYQPHQYNCSLFWQCTPDSRACLHECPPYEGGLHTARAPVLVRGGEEQEVPLTLLQYWGQDSHR